MYENKKGAMHADQSTAKLQKMTIKNHQPNNTTITPDLSTIEPYCTILNMLETGEKNAVHLKAIINRTELKNREARKCIEQLRRSGFVIVSNSNGYFIPETPEELQKYINQETHRAKSVFYTLKNARQLLQQIKEAE
ncbi:MAG: hypothetical protein E7415_01435 [Ruminococcaceae bacterium]|nr:hypothetical protein [Oscillospiraceae bacterium]